MSKEAGIVNRVAQSPLVTLNLEDYYQQGERVQLDIKGWLFQEMILREKDFRDTVKSHDWGQYSGKHVALMCSVDAIIPTWAWMLITTRLEPYAATVIHGGLEELEKIMFKTALDQLDVSQFADKKIVVKGCGHLPVPDFAYVEITRRLRPVASSIMYGEPCSTVPLYKKPKK